MQQKYAAWGRVKSCIRELTAYGSARKAEIGADKVFDFSIGSPSAPVPAEVWEAMREALKRPDVHEKTPPEGLPALREAVARDLSRRYALDFSAQEIQIVTGAAGGLAVCLNALLSPGSEAVVLAPFFPEYRVFIEGAGGTAAVVPARADMQPELDALREAVGEKTRLVIVNTPNNPTGAILSEESLRGIAEILREASERWGRPVYLISDEPYRELCFDRESIPCVMTAYENTLLCYSFSKSLSLPGERLGYLLVPDASHEAEEFITAATIANRISGIVNAPSLIQLAIARCLEEKADLDFYAKNGAALYDGLTGMGYECLEPQGAFYLWVKAPCDEHDFVVALKEEHILVTPGSAFAGPGYVRISYCVAHETILNSMPGFRKVMEACQR